MPSTLRIAALESTCMAPLALRRAARDSARSANIVQRTVGAQLGLGTQHINTLLTPAGGAAPNSVVLFATMAPRGLSLLRAPTQEARRRKSIMSVAWSP